MIPADVRRNVYARAGGRCEYCLIPDTDGFDPHQIDHIYAEKHGGTSEASNLCVACWVCNRQKGTDLASLDPIGQAITPLYHPLHDKWTEHLGLNGAHLDPLTAQGRITVRLLQLNRPDQLAERQIMLEMGLYP